jgi:hypothetical protein
MKCAIFLDITLCSNFFTASGVGLSPLYCGHFCPIVPAPDDRWGWLWSNWWNEDWQGKPKYSEKTCPSATLSTTDPTWPDPGSNQGRRGKKPATNRLSYGAARVPFIQTDFRYEPRWRRVSGNPILMFTRKGLEGGGRDIIETFVGISC